MGHVSDVDLSQREGAVVKRIVVIHSFDGRLYAAIDGGDMAAVTFDRAVELLR